MNPFAGWELVAGDSVEATGGGGGKWVHPGAAGPPSVEPESPSLPGCCMASGHGVTFHAVHLWTLPRCAFVISPCPGSGSDPLCWVLGAGRPPCLIWVLFLPHPLQVAGTRWLLVGGTEVSRGPGLLAGCHGLPSAPRAHERNYNLAKLRTDRLGSCLFR